MICGWGEPILGGIRKAFDRAKSERTFNILIAQYQIKGIISRRKCKIHNFDCKKLKNCDPT